MADTIKLTILSPERKFVEALAVQAVTLPGSEGQIQILPGHAPMIGTLHTGFFSYQGQTGEEEMGVISSGFFEVNGDEVTVTAETIERRAEIDVARAKAAQAKAEAALQSPELDEHAFKKYQLKIERALIRQQAANHGQ